MSERCMVPTTWTMTVISRKTGSQTVSTLYLGSRVYGIRQRLPVGIRQAAEFLLQQTIAGCDELTASRSQAYALIGLHHWNDGQSRDLLLKLASDLSSTYRYNSGKDWKWFDERLTYCNAVMPWAMLSAYEATQEKRYQDIGFESLDFYWCC